MTRASWKSSRVSAATSLAWEGGWRTWILASCVGSSTSRRPSPLRLAMSGGGRRSASCLIVYPSSDRWYHASQNEKSPSCCRRMTGQLGFRIDSIQRGGGWVTWSEKKTAKAARRRMPRSLLRISAA
ncbi:hypothetical protein ZWY2020_006693 [Hordeum vulgare]|nr:hypothetical protein ZWY2020_006693 [Hordeum vulgare]